MKSASDSFSFHRGQAGTALEPRVAELRKRLQQIPPPLIAERTGAELIENYQLGTGLRLNLLGESVTLACPDFCAKNASGDPLPGVKQALVLYYLCARGTQLTAPEDWISFAELPEGRVYASAFQGYTGDLISRLVALDIERYHSMCHSHDGERSANGGTIYVFKALPKIRIALVYHLGDEDFPSNCGLLFDRTVSSFLPTEACAILGGMFVQKLMTNPLSA
jgi:hypothetical protein